MQIYIKALPPFAVVVVIAVAIGDSKMAATWNLQLTFGLVEISTGVRMWKYCCYVNN